jgi:glycolate oxidase
MLPPPLGQTDRVARALEDDLAAVVGRERVHGGELERSLYQRDASLLPGDVPALVCFPTTAAEVQGIVRACRRHDVPFVARGSGTGLAGGAVPIGEAVVVVTTKMTAIRSIDPVERVAWVEPGVVNLDLSRACAIHGLQFAPDPSSQQVCTVGGNVATNSGGPHCLAYGVTSAHVLAIEVVLPDGDIVVLGGLDPAPLGYDLRGAFVGSEGMLGVATGIAVRLTPLPPAVETLLADLESVDAAAGCVSAVIAAGIVPAALEMMDQRITEAAEAFVHAGYPTDAAAVLLVEVDGLPAGVTEEAALIERIARDHGARSVRVAADDAERALLWKGRKTAFGAVARIAPNYYLHDTVVPRRKLVAVLRAVYEIAARHDLLVMNVFHAGDGNLHPLLVFDAREPGVLERVHAAGDEIVRASIDAGGVLSGEHGVGLEKQPYMELLFGPDDLAAQAQLCCAFDPDGRANPGKVLPSGSRCGDLAQLPEGVWV